MKLAVTIDVEEEGLFNGSYPFRNISVKNIACLKKLDPIFTELKIRPTLFISYQVANHQAQAKEVLRLINKWGGEAGAHLHPWNTPPEGPSPHPEPVPSEWMNETLLKAKLDTLLKTIRRLDIKPVSFRMGRFNMGPKMFQALEDAKIKVDSSISPMRKYYGGPAHIIGLTDPYFPEARNPLIKGTSRILEVPLTILPLTRNMGLFLDHLENKKLLPQTWVSWFSMYLGSLSAQPMATGLIGLKAAVNRHRARNGKVLTLYFHSSELFPGGCPQHPTKEHTARFLEKLQDYFSWLINDLKMESLTVSELYDHFQQRNHGPEV